MLIRAIKRKEMEWQGYEGENIGIHYTELKLNPDVDSSYLYINTESRDTY